MINTQWFIMLAYVFTIDEDGSTALSIRDDALLRIVTLVCN